MVDIAENIGLPDPARSKPTRTTPVNAGARPANAEGAQTRASGSELVARPAAKDTDKTSALSPSFATAETDTPFCRRPLCLFEYRSGIQSESSDANVRASSNGVGGADL